MTIKTSNVDIGLIHAMAPDSWKELDRPIINWIPYLWSTQKFSDAQRKKAHKITNVDLVVHGHVGCHYIEQSGNQIWIDTLMGSGRLTVTPAAKLVSLIK